MSQEYIDMGGRSQTDGWASIIPHYERRLRLHGATPAGVGWPNGADLAVRFGIMLELVAEVDERPQLLDLGCGPGLMLDYLAATGVIDRIDYHGIDLSGAMVDLARKRWPKHAFSSRDIVAAPLPHQSVDVVVINGVLTERVSLAIDAMTSLAEALIAAAFRTARIGIAFNVMNAHVDWQRDDLFHWPFDALAEFLKREVSPHYVLRADYGLYEYICMVRRRPRRPVLPLAETWWSR
jgi:SAM-dependent methyltransferase